jgi:transcriptional accessory protein Tex/SPT6
MVKYYFDLSSSSSGENWNLLRKQVLIRMLSEYFFPAFMEEIKEDLTREGEREIIESCCQKFRGQLSKGQSLKNGQPIKILAMVLEQEKLGIAVVDEIGKEHSPLSIELRADDELKKFVNNEILSHLIEEHHPDMILVSANCRRAQTLRKELRNPSLFSESNIYCSFGEYEIPSLMANKNIVQGVSSEKCILEAISMARLKKNPMMEILGLWSESIEENGVYSMNLHPFQKYIDKRKLVDALEKVAI